MKKKYKIIFGSIIAALVAASLFLEQSKPLKVSTLKIEMGDIYDEFKEEGIVQAKEEYHIYSKYGGKIESIDVTPGQRVEAGQVLMRLDSKDKEYEIEISKGNLKSAKGQKDMSFEKPLDSEVAIQESNLELAKIVQKRAQMDYDNYRSIYGQGGISLVEFQRYEDILKSANENLKLQQKALELLYESREKTSGKLGFHYGNIEALNAQVKYLNYQLENSVLKSPTGGIVSDFNIKAGQIISPTEFLMSVYDDKNLVIETFVLSEDIRYLSKGQQIRLIQESKEKDIEFTGVISAIAPNAVEKISTLGLEEQRVKVTVDPDLDEDVLIKPGYEIDCEFITGSKSDVIVIPKTSIFKDKDVEMVWVNENSKARIRTIETGFENSTDVVVTSGLQEGDHIILNPQAEGLDEGKKIESSN